MFIILDSPAKRAERVSGLPFFQIYYLAMDDVISQTREAYDNVAQDYAEHIFGELAGKPLDRALLDHFAERVRRLGLAVDMGCGPGQVARYLKDRGIAVMGVDLSTQMVEVARRLNPGIPFKQGNMLALDEPDGAWGGIAAFYSIIHIPRARVPDALRELKRVLIPGGLLLLAIHRGSETLPPGELWGKPMGADFIFFTAAEMQGYLRQAGFAVEQVIERAPYAPEVEHQSYRVYIFATRS